MSSEWEAALALRSSEGLRSALIYLEREIRHCVSVGESDKALRITKQLATLCNKEAATQSQEEAVVTLRRAKSTLDYIDRQITDNGRYPESLFRLQLITCSSLASALKSLGDSRRAYQYLLSAQSLIEKRAVPDSTENLQSIASTKVNISTVQLELKMYPEAIAFAEQCLHLLQMRLALTFTSLADMEKQDNEKYRSMLQSYLAAMFNIAIAEEARGNREAAVKSYAATVKFGKTYGEGESIVEEAEKALAELMESATEREMTTAPSVSSRPHLAVKSSAQLSHSMKVPHKPATPGSSYYSREHLLHLHSLISKGDSKPFISSSQYFHQQVCKNLRLDQDIHHLSPVSQRELAKTSRQSSAQDPDKRSVAQLRQRKYRRRQRSKDAEERGGEYVKRRIESLRKQGSVGRRRLLSESARVRPGELSVESRSSKKNKEVDSRLSDVTTSATRIQSQLAACKPKEEIEALMSQLQSDLRLMHSSPVRPSSARITTRSELASSVLKTLSSSLSKAPEAPESPKRRAAVTFQHPL